MIEICIHTLFCVKYASESGFLLRTVFCDGVSLPFAFISLLSSSNVSILLSSNRYISYFTHQINLDVYFSLYDIL